MSMKDCRVDFMTNTVTMTKKFYENATRPGSPEYEIYKTIRKDNPHIRPVIKSSSKKKNAARERLSYQQMINYIDCLPDHDNWMCKYEQVRHLSKSQKNKYGYVLNWFLETFPDYSKLPSFDENGTLRYTTNVIPFNNIIASSNPPLPAAKEA